MGKNKKSEIVYNDLKLDSNEELQFIYWLDECKQHNLVLEYIYQPIEFNLSSNIVLTKKVQKSKKIVDKEYTLLNKHIYTPDFLIKFSQYFINLIQKNNWSKIFKYIPETNELYCDIKGTFNQGGGDRVFSINQKWVYQIHNIYVQKIVPQDLFKLTFCPQLARLTPKKKQVVEKYKNFKNITDIIKEI